MLIRRDYINLFVYSDSLAFRRPEQDEDACFTYPFLLKDLIETNARLRVNLLFRGLGGADMPHIRRTIERDAGYFRFSSPSGNIAIVQAGVVDCAPRPFTYRFSPLLKKLPRLGPRIIGWLHRHRSPLQKVSSYRLTSQKRFVSELKRIMELFGQMRVSCVFTGIPVPHDAIELRSPGFQRAVSEYNELIKKTVGVAFCDIEARVMEAGRENCLLQDGHHLSERGHVVYSTALLETIASIDPSLANGKTAGLHR